MGRYGRSRRVGILRCPQHLGHCVELAEIKASAERVFAIEEDPSALRQQLPPQSALQQVEPQQRFIQRRFRITMPGDRPARLDLADTRNHDLVVTPVRTAVERHPGADAGCLGRWQQQAVAAEIVKPDPRSPNIGKQGTKAALREQLTWQQVVPLQAGIVRLRARPVNRAKRDDVQTGSATPRRHLFSPHTDKRSLARGSQDQSRAIWRGDVVIRFKPADEDEVIDQTDRKPGSRHPVGAERWFDPQFPINPEREAHALQRAIGRFDKGRQPQGWEWPAIEPSSGDGFEKPPSRHAARRFPSDRKEIIEMPHQIAGKRHHRADYRQALSRSGNMRPGSQRHRFALMPIRHRGQVDALWQCRHGTFGSGGKAREIEGEPIAHHFQPVLLAGAERFGLGRVFEIGIVADADHRTTRRKRPDRIPIRPLARGKQQMQFSVISALRL